LLSAFARRSRLPGGDCADLPETEELSVIFVPANPDPVGPTPAGPADGLGGGRDGGAASSPITATISAATSAPSPVPGGAHRPVTLARGRHANPDGAGWQALAFARESAPEPGSAESVSEPESGSEPAPASGTTPDSAGVAVSGQLGAVRSVALPDRDVIVLPDWNSLPSMEVRVDLTGVERRRARQSTRKALSWHGRFVIVHTGNIGIRQGLEELAGALRRLAEVQPDVTVAFSGNGNRRQALVQATTGLGNVEIRDPVPPDQLFAVLLAADLLLVSERSDGADITVPSKLTSYFAAARPVLAVVDEGSAIAEELQRSGAGVLVDPGDPLGFTAAVALLRSDPAERARLGDAGLRFVAAEAMSRLS
jgi:glycosyltransferase involved in cell wall biosynthesis